MSTKESRDSWIKYFEESGARLTNMLQMYKNTISSMKKGDGTCDIGNVMVRKNQILSVIADLQRDTELGFCDLILSIQEEKQQQAK